MIIEEFLKDVCPNHTDKSQWNKSELLYILELHTKQLPTHDVDYRKQFDMHAVVERREQLNAFVDFYNNRKLSHERINYDEIEIFLESI